MPEATRLFGVSSVVGLDFLADRQASDQLTGGLLMRMTNRLIHDVKTAGMTPDWSSFQARTRTSDGFPDALIFEAEIVGRA